MHPSSSIALFYTEVSMALNCPDEIGKNKEEEKNWCPATYMPKTGVLDVKTPQIIWIFRKIIVGERENY